jgi:hypothetical protein
VLLLVLVLVQGLRTRRMRMKPQQGQKLHRILQNLKRRLLEQGQGRC